MRASRSAQASGHFAYYGEAVQSYKLILLITVAAMLLAAYLLHRLVEKPLAGFIKRKLEEASRRARQFAAATGSEPGNSPGPAAGPAQPSAFHRPVELDHDNGPDAPQHTASSQHGAALREPVTQGLTTVPQQQGGPVFQAAPYIPGAGHEHR